MDKMQHVTPPTPHLPIIQHLIDTYKAWHDVLQHVARDVRYTLGAKIDVLLIDTMELIFVASYLGKQEKLPYLKRAASKLDLAKFFLHVMWDVRAFNNEKYLALSEKLDSIGKMLGGWRRGIESKTPAA